MNKRNVYLAQVNHAYGRNVFLPYSVGLLQAYALTIPEIADSFAFRGFFFLREEISKVLARMEKPDVFGVSCYIWNARYSLALAEAVKAAYPDCLIVLGGPHVPVRSEGFFKKHPYADILVHYEGELTFAEVLKQHLTHSPYTHIQGVTVKGKDGVSMQTPPRPRTENLALIPSPYLTGVFDDLMALDYDFHASQETHRGCPYSCTFCDWGSNTMAKVKGFETERLLAEFEWFGQRKIEMLYNCDANYGLLPRDFHLTVAMAETKKRYGYPQRFRAAYAKKSNDGIFRIAEVLNRAEMNKGITLSFQSMDEHTLEVVKRQNIKVQDFKALMRRYREAGIATYSELIIALPGETYSSFAEGINTLVAAGQHDSLQVYTCEVLPNSEMNDPLYREQHGIKTVKSPMPFFHATPVHDPHGEHYEIVVSTATLSKEEWVQTQLYAWAVQCFHCLSLTQAIAVFLHTQYGTSYRLFYERLLSFAEANPETLLGKEWAHAKRIFEGVLEGGEWYMFDERFGNVSWPPEEGSFLKLVAKKSSFYEEIREFLKVFAGTEWLCLPDSLCEDLLRYQAMVVIDPFSQSDFSFPLEHNLVEFLDAAYLGEKIPLRQDPCMVSVKAENVFSGDLAKYAREIVWYGRKGGKFRYSNIGVSQRQA